MTLWATIWYYNIRGFYFGAVVLARQMDIYCSCLKYLMVQRVLNEMHGYVVYDEDFYQKCKIHELLIKDSCRRAGSICGHTVKNVLKLRRYFLFHPMTIYIWGKLNTWV